MTASHVVIRRMRRGKLTVKDSRITLKEYYEIVDEARPLSGFVPTHADFFYRNAFQSDPSANFSQLTFEK